MNIFSIVLLILVSMDIYAKDKDFIFSAFLVGMSMDYKEYARNGELLDSEESSYLDLVGVEMSLGYVMDQDIFSSSEISFDFMILGGETQYVGSLRDSDEKYGSYIDSTFNNIIDTDVSYKRSHILKNSVEFTYGVGLGYREWKRALSASQVEVYSWYSIRPIVGVSATVIDGFNLGINVEYQFGFDTIMSASDLNYNFTLGGADILEVSLPITYEYDENINFYFEATFQKQTIVESDKLYIDSNRYYQEPKSTAYNNYLKFGASYKF